MVFFLYLKIFHPLWVPKLSSLYYNFFEDGKYAAK